MLIRKWMKKKLRQHNLISPTLWLIHIYIQAFFHLSSHFLQSNCFNFGPKLPFPFLKGFKLNKRGEKQTLTNMATIYWLYLSNITSFESNGDLWLPKNTYCMAWGCCLWREEERVSCHGTNCVCGFCSQLVKVVSQQKKEVNIFLTLAPIPKPNKRQIKFLIIMPPTNW